MPSGLRTSPTIVIIRPPPTLKSSCSRLKLTRPPMQLPPPFKPITTSTSVCDYPNLRFFDTNSEKDTDFPFFTPTAISRPGHATSGRSQSRYPRKILNNIIHTQTDNILDLHIHPNTLLRITRVLDAFLDPYPGNSASLARLAQERLVTPALVFSGALSSFAAQ
ncbi:hypothetical protein H0H81_000208 [Sphagnurus paluster]|uniref:Uncharacterized protein n=1 Tax=Sphagnurus paluster TaxID=117069 RepID=A0A9P7K201_9AGAR|nr:hypothetical protein H0H81_000208 [Sphagnurus paluster]